MPPVFREVTTEQQDGLLAQKLFEAEYNYMVTSIDAVANPNDATLQQAVQDAEQRVNNIQAAIDGGSLIVPTNPAGDNPIDPGP